eukprot:CAMPEP_0172816490 /NCGR_PEP_ID=MMETSP1075-20121228/12512_1 /TAXON_ID=2916 /ORGANISM="Ceratium fusus, Strain PA161109" /LENGTH=60 /DNA_ID=CAMNT_0013656501 /DNA_START=57 /DNA_END=236 /DNA_ORIENTATION=+
MTSRSRGEEAEPVSAVIRQMTVGATLRAMGADDGIVHQAATDGLLLTAEPVSAAAASAKE